MYFLYDILFRFYFLSSWFWLMWCCGVVDLVFSNSMYGNGEGNIRCGSCCNVEFNCKLCRSSSN